MKEKEASGDKTQRPNRKRGANAVTTASTLTTKTLFASTREELLEIQVGPLKRSVSLAYP